ncbi:MAG: hypothetical protein HUJ26_18895 [Planctomycetaceae bacterium]|nr:hypothetical protein [Planctomycetaceae bacterium]
MAASPYISMNKAGIATERSEVLDAIESEIRERYADVEIHHGRYENQEGIQCNLPILSVVLRGSGLTVQFAQEWSRTLEFGNKSENLDIDLQDPKSIDALWEFLDPRMRDQPYGIFGNFRYISGHSSYTITFNGYTSGPIPPNASPATIEQVLASMPCFENSSIEVSANGEVTLTGTSRSKDCEVQEVVRVKGISPAESSKMWDEIDISLVNDEGAESCQTP